MNAIVYLLRKVWKFSKENRKNVILYAILFIIANLINFLWPLAIAELINIIQVEGITSINLMRIMIFASFVIILTLLFWAFHGPARVIEVKNAFIVRKNYKMYLLNGTMDLESNWHSDHHSGDTIDKIEKGTIGLYEFSGRTYEIIETLIRFTSSYIALIYFNIHSAYIVAIMVFLTLTVIVRFDRHLIKQYIALNRMENSISAKIFDSISNITTIIILRVEKLISGSIYQKIIAPFSLFKKNIKLNETKWAVVSFSSSVMMFLVLATYILKNYYANTAILSGTLFVLYTYVDRINGLFFRFAYKYGEIVKQKTSVMNAEEIAQDFKNNESTSKKIQSNWKEINIENLHFSYSNNETELHLDDVNITIKRKQRIALMGESGSGKTTLLKIIRELYTPNKNNIFINNKRIESFKEISSSIALIPQDPEIFSTTIKENITIGTSISKSKLNKYSKIACFEDVVRKLPKGYESLIYEKGVNLSGGEKQRLALTRGLLASENKEIILLDEPTSSIDYKNEYQIYQNIFKNFKKKTILSSIHRLHLLPLFDYIIYFNQGKIIMKGTFEELLKNKKFKKIWEESTKKLFIKK